MSKKFKFDIAISFAEEDRNIAVALACGFKLKKIKPYYYPDNTTVTLGYQLEERLQRLYEDEAQYAVVVLSEHYLKKGFCQLEIQAIKQRMAKEKDRYLVVVRTDRHLPKDLGISDDLCYKEWQFNPEEIAENLFEMLGNSEETENKSNQKILKQNVQNFNGTTNVEGSIINKQNNTYQ